MASAQHGAHRRVDEGPRRKSGIVGFGAAVPQEHHTPRRRVRIGGDALVKSGH